MSGGAMGVTGVLLAGGLSRRMGGGDKGLLELAGQPMLAHAIARLSPQVSELVLNANGDPARFDRFGLPVVADPVEGFAGPLAGVLAGCRWSAAHAPANSHIVTAAADTPFFPTGLVAALTEAATEPGMIVLASSGGRVHPVFGLWPVSLGDALEAWLSNPDNRKILKWVNMHPHSAVTFDTEGSTDPFFNVNTPEELAEAERALASAP